MSSETRNDTPYWRLISVLFSSVPLTDALAMRLQKAAFELYAADETSRRLRGEMLTGEVRNLQKTAVLGSISGPVFEADLETERGHGVVRYLLTKEGVELFARSRPRHMLN